MTDISESGIEAYAWEAYWGGAGSVDSVTRFTASRTAMEHFKAEGAQITPLYRHPPASREEGIREALAAATKMLNDKAATLPLNSLEAAAVTSARFAVRLAILALLSRPEPKGDKDRERGSDWNGDRDPRGEGGARMTIHDIETLIGKLRGYCIDWNGQPMRDAETPRCETSCGELRQAADLIEALQRERDEAREALKPFAEHDVGTVEGLGLFSIPDEHPLLGTGLGNDWKPSITVGDFRRAREALREQS